MANIETLIPDTRQYRDTLRSALQTHNIAVVENKTRNYQGNFWDLCTAVGAGQESWRSYNLVRTVTFHVEKNERVDSVLLNQALRDVEIWSALCGTHLLVKIDCHKQLWRIQTACVISN